MQNICREIKVVVLIIGIVLGTRIRPNKMKQQVSVEKKEEEKIEDNETSAAQVQVEIIDEPIKEIKEKKEEDDVKDSWDADTTDDEQEEEGLLCFIYKIIWSRDLLHSIMIH